MYVCFMCVLYVVPSFTTLNFVIKAKIWKEKINAKWYIIVIITFYWDSYLTNTLIYIIFKYTIIIIIINFQNISQAGVHTPSVAFRDTSIIESLHKAGISFSTVSQESIWREIFLFIVVILVMFLMWLHDVMWCDVMWC